MPRSSGGVYSKPAGTTAVAGTTIESAKYNQTIDDLVQDANTARPITAGGTGAVTAASALTNLGADGRVVFSTKTGSYTAVADDNNGTIRFTSTATLSLTAAATLGANWHCTVIANGGVVTIDPNGSETIDSDTSITLSSGLSTTIYCDGTAFFTERMWRSFLSVNGGVLFGNLVMAGNKIINVGAGVPRYVQGLEISNNASNPNNAVNVAIGEAKSANRTAELSTVISKRLDAGWAAGGTAASPVGGLDTGVKQTSQSYHAHLIIDITSGAVDVLLSLSATAPTLPSGWAAVERLGAILTDASGNIRPFTTVGKTTLLATAVPDVNDSTLSTTSKLYTLSVPKGVSVDALYRAYLADSALCGVLLTSPLEADRAASTSGEASLLMQPSTHNRNVSEFRTMTNTSGQIRAVAAGISLPIDTFNVFTYGWIDHSLRRI